MRVAIIATFIIISIFSGIVFHQSEYIQRGPSSVRNASNCYSLILKILTTQDSIIQKIWRRVNPKGVIDDLDWENFYVLRKRYLNQIDENASLTEVNSIGNTEELLAFLDALNLKSGLDSIDTDLNLIGSIRKMNLGRKLATFNFNKKKNQQQINNFISDIYKGIRGTNYKIKNVLLSQDKEKELLARIIQEDIAKMGLYKVLELHGKTKNLNWFYKFTNSKTGKILGSSIFNLPFFMGNFPIPLFLPGTKSMRISEDLLLDTLRYGIDNLGARFPKYGIKLRGKVAYETMKKYYMTGVSIYLMYAMYDDYKKNQKELDEKIEHVDNKLKGIEEYSQSISSDYEKLNAYSTTQEDCSIFNECLNEAKEILGFMPAEESEDFQLCRELFDSDQVCN